MGETQARTYSMIIAHTDFCYCPTYFQITVSYGFSSFVTYMHAYFQITVAQDHLTFLRYLSTNYSIFYLFSVCRSSARDFHSRFPIRITVSFIFIIRTWPYCYSNSELYIHILNYRFPQYIYQIMEISWLRQWICTLVNIQLLIHSLFAIVVYFILKL